MRQILHVLFIIGALGALSCVDTPTGAQPLIYDRMVATVGGQASQALTEIEGWFETATVLDS